MFAQTSIEIANQVKFASSAGELMQFVCFSSGNQLIVDYRYFKHIASPMSYQLITSRITDMIDEILSSHPKFVAHTCSKTLTVSDIDKHLGFIKSISNLLKTRYQDKMSKCYIYKAPFIFAQIYGIVSCFIDKDTQAKIELV